MKLGAVCVWRYITWFLGCHKLRLGECQLEPSRLSSQRLSPSFHYSSSRSTLPFPPNPPQFLSIPRVNFDNNNNNWPKLYRFCHPKAFFTYFHNAFSLFQSAFHCLPSHASNTRLFLHILVLRVYFTLWVLNWDLETLLFVGPTLNLLSKPWLVNARGANHSPRTKVTL